MNKKAILGCLLIGCLLASLGLGLVLNAGVNQAQAQGGLADIPWPMFQHDLQHTGRSPCTGPETPGLKWSYTTGDGVDSSLAIGADSTIYLGSRDGKLYAIAEALQVTLNEIQDEVSDLRGLNPLREVDRQFITRDELRGWLVEESEEDIEEINITQELFVLLDLMEEGRDLYNILLDLYSEQILGFYDIESQVLYVVSDMEELGPLEEVTFAHEFTHALQDQHFDLGSLPMPEDNSDFSMAVECLIEGDGSLLEGVYYWVCLDEAEQEAYDQQTAEFEDGAFEAAPWVVQENLLFPYVSGVEFVCALWEQGGWDAVNQAYSDPPQSTEQILHP